MSELIKRLRGAYNPSVDCRYTASEIQIRCDRGGCLCRNEDIDAACDALEQAEARYRKLAASLSYEKEGRTISPAARIEQLEAALEKYGQHLSECTEKPLFCDCGLLTVRRSAGDSAPCDHDWYKWFVKDDAGNAVWNGDISCPKCGTRDRVRDGSSEPGTDFREARGALSVPDQVCAGCDGTGGPDHNCAGCGGTGIHKSQTVEDSGS